jgi:hypothetical protein
MGPAGDGHSGRHSADDTATDEARVNYLSGDADVVLDAADQAELDELRALLADPTLWAEPPAELEDSVVGLITAESAATRGEDQVAGTPEISPAPGTPSGPPAADTPTAAPRDRPFRMTGDPGPLEAVNDDGSPIDLAAARDRRVARDSARAARGSRRRWARPGILVAAAAAVIAVALTGVLLLRDTSPPQRRFDVALSATELAPGASGDASMIKTNSGWEIHLQAVGLPRLENGQFYQAWLRNADGVLVPIGSFNEGTDVALWAGVSPETFSTFTITKEAADGKQDSSGQRVMSGSAVEQH